MASEAASALVKPPPVAASPQRAVDSANASTPAPAAAAALAPGTSLSSGSTTNNPNLPSLASLPDVRLRKGSSEDCGASDLGSIGGSIVGFGIGTSVEFSVSGIGLATSSNGSTHNNTAAKDGVNNTNSNAKQNTNTSNIISNLKGVRTSPSGRRPFRKRKASVDFSFPALSIDDSDSSYSVSQLLPQHHGLAGSSSTKAPAAAVGTRSILTLPSPASRSRLYSDLTIPESLLASVKDNPNSTSKSDKAQPPQLKPKPKANIPPKEDQTIILPSADALPAMEDDSLPPIDNDSHSLILSHPESPANQTTSTGSNIHPALNHPALKKDRAYSFASIRSEGNGLDRLDSLGVEATISAARIRKGSSVTSNHSKNSQDSNNSYDGTLGSQSHRFLMEAFLGDGTESLVLNPSQRERLGSFDAAAEVTGSTAHSNSANNNSNANNQSSSNSHQIVIPRERLNSIGGRRNRLESWGGMSDLSLGMKDLKADQNLSEPLGTGLFGTGASASHSNNSGGSGAAAGAEKTAALAATIYTSLANDVTAAANGDGNESVSSFLVHDEKIPSRISVNNHQRDRFNSIASMGTEASALVRFAALNDMNDADFSSDVQNFIHATITSVEDQLADLATAVEAVSKDVIGDQDSEISSTASPMIGAASDLCSATDSVTGRPRSSSVSSMLQISVDYDAVAAAVHAAEAAAGALDLSSFTAPPAAGVSSSSSIGSQRNSKKRSLPIHKKPPRATKKGSVTSKKSPKKKRGSETLPPAKRPCLPKSKTPLSKPSTTLELTTPVIPKTKMDDQEMERLRERARAAAGYVPPSLTSGSNKAPGLPPKKRNAVAPATPANPPRPSMVLSGSNFKTPTISNTASSKYNAATPASAYSSGTPASSTKGQSSQKWESMFECLLKFIEHRKKDGTAGMTEEQKAEWAWDGNVPTTYKTKDGKALGRWVNNQRSAKSKGSLKLEREKRLVDAGLKWSVLASNSWNEMLEELRAYVAEQGKLGKKWDGNVPTNYRIKVTKDKAKSFLKDDDEDKNLGRWVNRQRSMFQAGKLRKDRQLALEKIGLKWSMLATTSWESMFETLCEYIQDKKKGGNEWDGNVPANYRTEDIPPRALGRWINRQRSAYGKNKLKPEYVAKLNEIGLKWSIHERRPTFHQYRPDAAKSSSAQKVPETVKSTESTTPTSTAPTVATSTTAAAPKPPPSTVQNAVTSSVSASKVNDSVTPGTSEIRPDSVGSTTVPVATQQAKKPPTAAATPVATQQPKATAATATASVATQLVTTATAATSVKKQEAKMTAPGVATTAATPPVKIEAPVTTAATATPLQTNAGTTAEVTLTDALNISSTNVKSEPSPDEGTDSAKISESSSGSEDIATSSSTSSDQPKAPSESVTTGNGTAPAKTDPK